MSAEAVLLVHGAWQGAWAWERLVPLLTARGLTVIAVDLPGNGGDGHDPATVTLEACLDHLDACAAPFERVSVVGHSGGGLIASAWAERCTKVARLAYVAGMMLPAQTSFAEVQAMTAGECETGHGITPHLIWSPDRRVSQVPAVAAQAIFFNDCPSQTAREASARLTPQGDGARAIRLTSVTRIRALPRLYIEATEDLSLPLAVQRRMQALMPGALVAAVPTGHVPQLSAPQLLADQLIPFLTGARDDEARRMRREPCPAARIARALTPVSPLDPTAARIGHDTNGENDENTRHLACFGQPHCDGRCGPSGGQR